MGMEIIWKHFLVDIERNMICLYVKIRTMYPAYVKYMTAIWLMSFKNGI